MTVEIANRKVFEQPTSEEIAASVASLDGKHKHTLTLRHGDGLALRLSRKRRPEFFAELLQSDDGVTVSKHSEKPLTQEQAIRAAQAFAQGRDAWPSFMMWQQDVEMTREARHEALAEERGRPLWKRIGIVLAVALGAWGMLLLAEGSSRGLGGMILGRYAPLLHKAILDGVVALCMAVGFELWMLMQLSEE